MIFEKWHEGRPLFLSWRWDQSGDELDKTITFMVLNECSFSSFPGEWFRGDKPQGCMDVF